MKFLIIVSAISLLVGCMLPLTAADDPAVAGRNMRQVSSVWDPHCSADGAVVLFQITNSQGSFNGAESSRENCPWFR